LNTKDQTLSSGVLVLIAIVIAVGAMLAAALLLSGGHTQAASVTPEFLEGASNVGKTCSDLQGADQTWTELKVDPNADGTFNDGTLIVTITNTTNDDTFDWTSNIGVDGVLAKGGQAGSNFYRYDPPAESTGDSDLGVPGPENNGISHISFCYDVEEPTPTPTPSPTPTPTVPPGETPTPTPTPTPAALGETQGPTALPATGQAGSAGPSVGLLLLSALGALLALGGTGAVAVAVRRRR
jgi:hypothetical protein